MDADFSPLVAALSELTDTELRALTVVKCNVPQATPGLQAWIEHAADWETHRRVGIDFPLQPPDAAIPSEEDAVTIEEAMKLRVLFAQDDRADAPGVANLLDAVVGVLTGVARRQ